MKKKNLFIVRLLPVCLCLMLGGCSDASNDRKETTSEFVPSTTVKSETTSLEETKKLEQDTDPKVEEKKQEPILIYEDEEVGVYYTGLILDGVTFEVDNKTEVNLTVQADSLAINGRSTNNIIMSDDIAPLSSGEAIALCDFDKNTEVVSISGKLNIFDFNNTIQRKEITFSGINVAESGKETTEENISEKTYVHKCEACSKEGVKSVTGFSGLVEWYCLDCYNEMMDTIGMMESDVGGGTASKHQCEECSKEGTHSIIGFSGKTEYYCTEHYNKMSEMLEMIQGN